MQVAMENTHTRSFDGLAHTWHFAVALLRAGNKNRMNFVLGLATPFFLLIIYWLTMPDDLLASLFPGLIGFTTMLASAPLAIRIVTWRQQGIFGRLACTPVSLGYLMLGAAGAQVVLGVVQAIVLVVFGVFVVGLPVNGLGALAAIAVLVLGSACFITYAALIASVSKRAETANSLFIFTTLPMFFLGGSMPAQVLPPWMDRIGAWLPFTLFNDLLGSLLTNGTLPANALLSVGGLVAYTLVFGCGAARLFRWE